MIRTSLFAASLALCGCDIGIDHRPQMRFIGDLTPTANATDCPTTRGVLVMRKGTVTFAPDEGTWVLDGVAGPETLSASRSRVTSDHKTYKTDLQARWSESAVQGTYTTPRCTYRVALARS